MGLSREGTRHSRVDDWNALSPQMRSSTETWKVGCGRLGKPSATNVSDKERAIKAESGLNKTSVTLTGKERCPTGCKFANSFTRCLVSTDGGVTVPQPQNQPPFITIKLDGFDKKGFYQNSEFWLYGSIKSRSWGHFER